MTTWLIMFFRKLGEAAAPEVAPPLTATLHPCHGSDSRYRTLRGANSAYERIAGADNRMRTVNDV